MSPEVLPERLKVQVNVLAVTAVAIAAFAAKIKSVCVPVSPAALRAPIALHRVISFILSPVDCQGRGGDRCGVALTVQHFQDVLKIL